MFLCLNMDMQISGLKAVLGSVLLAAGLLGSGLASGQTACGAVVTQASGTVNFQQGNDAPQAATPRRAIPQGAVVSTGQEAAVLLTFPDGQMVVLGEQTRFRIVNCRFDPKELGSSGMFLNLIEGSARLVMGAIGQFDPRLVRIQVGTGTVAGAPSPEGGARGSDASVSVQGAVTLLVVSQGRVNLTLPSGQSYFVSSGNGALVQADGSVQQGGIAQLESQASQTAVGKILVSNLAVMQSFTFAQREQQTAISLVTPPATTAPGTTTPPGQPAATPPAAPTPPSTTPPPSDSPPPLAEAPPAAPPPAEPPPVLDLPPIGSAPPGVTPPTGAGGGGLPCAASCN